MNAKQKELLDRIKKSQQREACSDYIAVGDSDLYDWDVTRRAVLMTIAFMQQTDEKKRVPEDSPHKHDYVGWCWASQKFIAGRVGTDEDYVSECIGIFEKDNVIRVRTWQDDWGYHHSEYQIVRETVDAHKRPDDWIKQERKRPRRGGNKAPNKGSFKPGNKAAAKKESHPGSQPFPSGLTAVSHPGSQPYASRVDSRTPSGLTADSETAASPSKGVSGIGGMSSVASLPQTLGGFDFGGVTSSPDRDLASAAPPSAGGTGEAAAALCEEQDQKQNQNGSDHEEHDGLKPKRRMGTPVKGEVKPLPNKLCYPDAFKDWKPGMRVPKCKKCGGNLQPNENHACPGYVPQLPFTDMPAHIERMRDQRWEHHELIANGRTSRRKPSCRDCGYEFINEEDALAHGEECPGYMSL